MKRKYIAVICTALICAALAGCGSSNSANGNTVSSEAASSAGSSENTDSSGTAKWKLGYSSLAFFDEGCKRIADGFTDHAADYPDFDITVLDGNSDMNTQISNIDAFWNSNVDVISIQAYPGIESNLMKFYEAGKPIIFVDFYPVITDEIKDMQYYYVGSGDYQCGYVQGEYLADTLPENGKVCEVIINFGQQNADDRSSGLHDALSKLRPDVEIIDTQAGMVDSATTMKVVEDWLQKYGSDGIDAITSQGTAMTSGIIEVLKAQNLTDKIQVVSCDESEETAKDWIGNGYLDATAYMDLQQISVKALDIAQACMEGNPPEEKEYYLERKIYTKDNLDQYGK